MNDKYLIAAVAFAVGMLLAKGAKTPPKDTSAHNEVSTSGDWWTFAGMWQAS